MANVGPSVWYCRDNAPTSTIGWSAVTAWASGATIAAGALRRQLATPTVGNERVFICIIAGTTGGSEPTWVITKGAKTTDNTVTWQECTGQPPVNGDLTNTPTWAQQHTFSTTITLGLIITDAAQDYYFIATTVSGVIGGSEPTWNKTAGVTTTDNNVTWTCIGTVGTFTAWQAPHARLANVFGAGWALAGSTTYISNDHAETQASEITIAPTGTISSPTNIICINSSTVPPTGATVTTGASVSSTASGGATGMLLGSGNTYVVGVAFNVGSGANSNNLQINGPLKLVNCALAKLGTGGVPYAYSLVSPLEAINTTFQFGSVSDGINVYGSSINWYNTPSAIAGSVYPTTLFTFSFVCAAILDGVDLSALGSGKTIFGAVTTQAAPIIMTNCKLGSSVTIAVTPSYWFPVIIDSVNCDSAGTNYMFQRFTYQGTLVPSTTVIRTGGASNGTTGVSYAITTTANSKWITPFECPPVAIWNTEIAVNATVTLSGIWNSASLPNNDQIWIDVEYMGSSGSPLVSLGTDTKANVVAAGSALTADSTSVWNSLATARQNTTAYTTASSPISVGSSNLVFWCVSNGTSSGSLPGAYASATDGQTVTDGTATFRAGTRFLLTTTLSSPQPQLVGYLRAIIKAALPSSTFWVDPLIRMS